MAKIRSDEVRQHRNILDIKDGEQPDNEYAILPAWNKLRNLYRDIGGKVYTRPFYVPASGLHNEIQGMFYDADNSLIYIADGTLYKDLVPETTVTVTKPVRFDVSRLRTVIATGGTPFVWIDEDNYFALPFQNVKALATFVGVQKLRLVFTTYDEPHKLFFTAIGDLTDTGKVIIDPRNIANDEWTEGFTIKNIPYEIVDLCELNGMVFVIHRRGAFTVLPGVDENGFRPELRERIDTEFLDVRACKDEGQIHLLGPEGPKRIFFDQGYPTFTPYPLPSIERTMREALVEDEAAICVDPLRHLMFVKPNNDDDTTYVWHFAGQFWTEWDGCINDAVSVAGTTYVSLEGGEYLYKLDDNGDGHTTIEGEFRTGITPILDEGLRKRLRNAHLHYTKQGELEVYSESVADEFLGDVFPVYAEAEDPHKAVFYLGDQGELFCLSFCFRTTGRIAFNQLVVEFLVKHPRLLN